MQNHRVRKKFKASKYIDWSERKYSSFMISIMRGLEPRQYQKNDIILKDRDEVEEILFVLKGDVSLLPALYLI
jgi:hypothetical protein